MLAGRRSPGRAVVKNAVLVRKWDEQQGYGLTGATLIFHGEELVKFDVEITLWEAEQFAEWRAFARGILDAPKVGANRDTYSLGISHPVLDDFPHPVQQCVLDAITQWEQDEVGLWVRTLKMHEYRAPKPVLVKADEGPPAINNDDPPDPAADGIRARLAEQKRLGEELARGSVPR